MRKDISKVIDSYRKGDISLFEASRIVDMHPSEFLELLVRRNKVEVAYSSF
ncbi:MAG: hypothetical protein J7L23_04825 [Candidatus Diapherotrites archaeon]|nr:hypothetical protein [Candidatus Diapherotrites archaeon]